MGLLVFVLFLLSDIFLIKYLKKEFNYSKPSEENKDVNGNDSFAKNDDSSGNEPF